MRRSTAALGSLLFLVLAPGTIAGLIPWWLTGWDVREPLPYWVPVRVVGAILLVGGVLVLLHGFGRFVLEGAGTPAPVAAPQRLVVGGLYRYVRNPMYLAILATIVGEALVLGQLRLLVYAVGVAAAFAAFVSAYEEPTLRRRFEADFDAYRRDVPAWLPRMPKGRR